MRSKLIALLGLLAGFCIVPIAALAGSSTLLGVGSPPPAGGYTGPADAVTGANHCYSFRACQATFATGSNVAVTIRRASDNATTNLVILANGNLDAASGNTFCNATTCFVTEWFDQIGTDHVVQATAATQPQISFSCVNSQPCLVNTSTTGLATGTITALSQPISYSAVWNRTTATSHGILVADDTSAGTHIDFQDCGSATTICLHGSGGTNITATASSSAWHSTQAVMNGALSVVNVDGTQTTGNPGTVAGGTGRGIGEGSTGGNNWIGSISEVVVYNSALTTPQQGTLCHNQYTYWGTSVLC